MSVKVLESNRERVSMKVNRYLVVASLIFVLGLLLSLLIWQVVRLQVSTKENLRFDHYADMIKSSIVERLNDHQGALHGLRAYIMGSEHVSRAEWSDYVGEIDVKRYRGSLGYAFVRYVKRQDLGEFLKETRADGAPGFQVRTSGVHPDLFVVEYIEPLSANLAAVGYDIGQEATRRMAAIAAVERNGSTLSGRIALIQDEQKLPGFLLMLPVFGKGLPVDTVEQRWQALRGWVDTPLRIDQLLEDIATENSHVDIQLFDGEVPGIGNLLFDENHYLEKLPNTPAAILAYYAGFELRRQTELEIAGRKWTLMLTALPGFTPLLERNLPHILFIFALLITTLAALLVVSGGRVVIHAQAIADAMTNNLRRSEQRFRRYFDLGLVGMAILSRDKQWLEFNDTLCSIFGCSRDEFISRNWMERTHPDDLSEDLRCWNQILAGDIDSYQMSKRFVHNDGHVLHAMVSVNAGRGVDGSIEYLLALVHDVSELWKTTEELKESRERYQGIVENTGDLIVRFDGSGNIRYVNPASIQYWGMAPEACIDKSIIDFVCDEDRTRTLESIRQWTKSGGKGESFENSLKHKSGKVFRMQWAISPLRDKTGRIIELTGIARDITSLRREEMILAAKLRIINFAAAHGINELLTNILDEAEILTGSCIGFFHFVSDDQSTIQLHAWSTSTVGNYCSAEGAGSHYPVADAGVWADCVRLRHPVIHNDYASLPDRKGFPQGHVPIRRELVVPVMRSDCLVAVLGVGNKPADYDEEDCRTVQRLADLAWETVVRKRAEADLAESECRYRLLFENMTTGFALHEMIYDGDGRPTDYRFLEINPAFERLTGLSSEALLGRTVREIMPETEPYWIDTYGRVAKSGAPAQFVNFSRELGKYFDVWAFCPERGQFAVIFSDISERVNNEQLLEASEAWHRTILKTALSGIWTVDLQGNFIEVNDAYCTMSGYSHQEFVGMNVADVEEIDSVDEVIRRIQSIIAAGDVSFESKHRRKDGTVYDVAIDVKYLPVAGGRCVAFVSDISERKRAEELLLKSNHALEKSQELGQIGTWELNLLDNTLKWTAETCRIFGIPTGAAIDYSAFLLKVHPDDREYVDKMWQEAINGSPYDIEHRIVVDGNVKWVREKADIRYDRQGVAVDAIGVVQDITVNKKIVEDQTRSAQLAMLGTIAAGVAHEINNPIQGIMNYATLIAQAPERVERVADISKRIIGESNRIAKITRDLLSYSKDNYKERSVVYVKDLIESALSLISMKINRRGVMVAAKYAQDITHIQVHPSSIQQVIVNLIDNAYDALVEHGLEKGNNVIEINCDRISVSDKTYLRIEVLDRGTGMSAATIKRAKEAFFTTKPASRGSGLGLSIVNNIIRKHNGMLDIESVEGEYTKVIVLLPIE